jgi:hypothetical protein
VNELTVTAQPGTRVQATLFYKKVNYEYDFEGPVSCYYTFDRNRKFEGTIEKGTTIGEQVFPESYVVFSEEGPTISSGASRRG